MLFTAACSATKPKQAADNVKNSRDQSLRENVSASCEVHMLLDPELVLDEEHKLKKELCDEFKIKKKYKMYGVVYIETEGREFNREGWSNRIRVREDKKDNEIKQTYKKRYPVSGTDLNGALKQAAADGFDLSDEDWKLEAEWGYSSITMSVSIDVKDSAREYDGIDDITLKEAIGMMKDGMPDKERDWRNRQWGIDMLEKSKMAGPVYFKRYTGKYFDQKVEIEVWELPSAGRGESSYITEMSYKADDYAKAAVYREMMMKDLSGRGLLMEDDALKTQKILDRYL